MESLNLKRPMNAICRTCLKARKKLTDIFSHVQDERTVKEMLVDCITIEVDADDGLPKNICSLCLKTLSLAFNFKTMAIDCDKKLRSYHQDLGAVEMSPSKKNNSLIDDNRKITPKIILEMPMKNENDCLDDIESDGSSSEDLNIEAPIAVKQERNANSESENSVDIDINEQSADLFSDEDQLNNTSDCENTETDLTPSSIIVEKDVDVERNNATVGKQTLVCKGLRSKSKADLKSGQKTICEYCNDSFKFIHYVDEHSHNHTGQLYKCDKCNKKFPKRYLLSRHKQLLHSVPASYECDDCGEIFSNASKFWQHRKKHAKGNAEQDIDITLKCPECDMVFTNKIALQRHNKRQCIQKSHACNDCDKSFSTKALLQNHSRIHTGKKPFFCEICDKTFKQKRYILQHMKTHK